MGGKKPLRRPLWPPTRATASNYYPLGLDGAGGAAKPLLRAPKKPAPLHGRLPAFSGAVDAFERARKCFLEWRYFFSIILSEFLKNRVALHTVKTKWYIINRYNKSHDDTIDESAVMLFLCDEQRGNLTEEQRTFAKEKKAEVHSSFSLSVFELILYQVMYSLHLVSGPEDFAAVFSKSKSGETSRQIPPCNGL